VTGALVAGLSSSYDYVKMDPEVTGTGEELVVWTYYRYRLKWSGAAIAVGAVAFGGLLSKTAGTVAGECLFLVY
jgi:hypothetical protein